MDPCPGDDKAPQKTSLPLDLDPMQLHSHLPFSYPSHTCADFSSFLHIPNSQVHVLSPNSSPGGFDFQLERRLKRMISNRESARRSRMRKKKQIEELQCQVNQIQAANHQLSERLIHLLECNQQVLQENAQLKEKVSSLQLILSDVLIPPRGINEIPHSVNRLKTGEPSNRSITRSMDLLL